MQSGVVRGVGGEFVRYGVNGCAIGQVGSVHGEQESVERDYATSLRNAIN